MSKLPKDHKMSDHKDVVGQVMHRWKHKDPAPLHSGRGKKGRLGKVVKDRDQAIAIALSVAGKSKDHSESFSSLGFSSEASLRANQLLQDSQKSAFLTGKRKGLFERENKITEAKGLAAYDIDSRSGTQPGSQGKKRGEESEKFSPLSLGTPNPQTTPPSLSNRKGYSLFKESGNPAIRPYSGRSLESGVSFEEKAPECPPPRSPSQRKVTQQAQQQAQQQGKTFDQMPTPEVKKLAQEGGQAQRKPKSTNCP